MPLRALVDGDWVVAPLLPPADWRLLAADLRAGRRLATLPCCDGLAHGRVSAHGLAHFVHQRRDGCAGLRESQAHLALKAAVTSAVAAAGWGVEPEAEGSDWRADVLATPRLPTTLDDLLGGHRHQRPWRVAFEIQLSRIDTATLLQRQARYARDRVRGCWLLQATALTGRRRGGRATGDEADWAAEAVATRLGLPPETPAFGLIDGEAPLVVCAGQRIALATFVTALLGRKLRYVNEMTPAARPLTALVYELDCPACGERCHPHLLAGSFAAVCGARGWLRRPTEVTIEPELEPAVVRAVADYRLTEAGAGLRPCPVQTTAAGRRGFHCPTCGRPLPPGRLAQAGWPIRRGQRPPTATLALPALAGLVYETAQPHWCLALEQPLCGALADQRATAAP